jgi:hypothetical protein
MNEDVWPGNENFSLLPISERQPPFYGDLVFLKNALEERRWPAYEARAEAKFRLDQGYLILQNRF